MYGGFGSILRGKMYFCFDIEQILGTKRRIGAPLLLHLKGRGRFGPGLPKSSGHVCPPFCYQNGLFGQTLGILKANAAQLPGGTLPHSFGMTGHQGASIMLLILSLGVNRSHNPSAGVP